MHLFDATVALDFYLYLSNDSSRKISAEAMAAVIPVCFGSGGRSFAFVG